MNVEEEYINELAKRTREKISKMKLHVSWDNKPSTLPKIDTQSTENLVKKTPKLKDAAIQYEVSPYQYKHKGTDVMQPINIPRHEDYSIGNETDTSVYNFKDYPSFSRKNNKKVSPPMILKGLTNNEMFVYLVDPENKNYSGSASATNNYEKRGHVRSETNVNRSYPSSHKSNRSYSREEYPNSYHHMFRDIEIDKYNLFRIRKKQSERLRKEKDYYNLIRQNFSPAPNIKNKLEVEMRFQKPIFKQLKDIKKVKLTEL